MRFGEQFVRIIHNIDYMGLIKLIYKHRHPGVSDNEIPAKYSISLWKGFVKVLRKYLSVVVIPTIPFNNFRVSCYRMIGYKIGKGSFIGMRCYLDDLCYDKIEIGSFVTISYGVYFACHGRNQGHNRIIIKDGAYIGMRASVIAPNDIIIGAHSIVGAGALVNKSVPDNACAVGVPIRLLDTEVKK